MGVKVREKKKGSGEWWIFINHNGHRTSRRIGDRSTAIAIAKRLQAKLVDDSFRIETPKPRNDTFGQYAKQWVETRAKIGLKYSTYRGYRLIIQKHLIPAFGGLPLKDLTPRRISEFVYGLFDAGHKSRTIRNIKHCLSAILQSAATDDALIPSNPARGVRVPTPEDERPARVPDPFTFEERARFEAVAKRISPNLIYPVSVIGFRMGLRIGEILALQIGDVDIHSGTVYVQRSIGRNRVTTPKSKTSIRFVRMTPDASDIIQHLITRLKEKRIANRWTDVDWLFPTHSGKHYTYGGIIKAWNRVMEAAGMRRRTPHDLRHTYATLRLAIGHPLAEVSKEMGHSTTKVTYTTYYKWMPSESTSDIADLDRTIGGIDQEDKKGCVAPKTHPIRTQRNLAK